MKTGYGKIKENEGDVLVHRISYRLENGDFDKRLQVCHRCDNPPCFNPKHLFLGTSFDNIQDCIRKGRFTSIGLAHHGAKLSDAAVREIRHLKGTSLKKLSERFEVSRPHIHHIQSGKRGARVK